MKESAIMKLWPPCLLAFLLLPIYAFADYNYYSHLPNTVKTLQPIHVGDSQSIDLYLNQKTENNLLISASLQETRTKNYLSQYFSPWQRMSYGRVAYYRHYENGQINAYRGNLGIGENFQVHRPVWFQRIEANIDIAHFPNSNQDAIAIDNTYVRLFPTIEPHFGATHVAGSGYPLDDFQLSVEWAGTPLHVLHYTQDGAWAFVLTPSVSGWVRTESIATVDDAFISQWHQKQFAALIQRKQGIRDSQWYYRFEGYLGAIFPFIQSTSTGLEILIPVKDINNQAAIKTTTLSHEKAALMPWSATPAHVALLIKQLLGEPYGWGGLYFYGDCSSTLKGLYTPFGIWLPRNSAAQALAYKNISLQTLSPEERRAAILKQGKPWMTLISVTGHVMLYIGESQGEVMTFQNVWAMVTMSRTNQVGRDVIGRAVLMSLKLSYGETGMFPQIDADNLRMTFLN